MFLMKLQKQVLHQIFVEIEENHLLIGCGGRT